MSVTIRFDDGDFEVGSTGEQIYVSAAEKAAQDTLDELLRPFDVSTDTGNEMFAPDGSLVPAVGSAVLGAATLRAYLRSSLTRIISQQAKSSRTDASERITKVDDVVVRAKDNDPTSYLFYISLIVNDEKIGLARAIRMRHLGDTPRNLLGGYDP